VETVVFVALMVALNLRLMIERKNPKAELAKQPAKPLT
jgi:hypothetical protein